MLKVRMFLMIISNIFMLNIASLFEILGMKSIVKIIINQANKNTDYIESMVGGNNNE